MNLYTLFLKNFIADFSIGIHDFEKAAKQRIIINAELKVRREICEDEIDNVVDYDFLVNALRNIAASEHINLQETLCERIIEICKQKSAIQGVIVSTQKPDVYNDCEGVGCRLEWHR